MKKYILLIISLFIMFTGKVNAEKYMKITNLNDIEDNQYYLLVVENNILSENDNDVLRLEELGNYVYGSRNEKVTFNTDGTIIESSLTNKFAFQASEVDSSYMDGRRVIELTLRLRQYNFDNGNYYDTLYLKNGYFFNDDYRKNVKIKLEKDGEFSIRSDANSYLSYSNNSWIISNDKTSRVSIYRRIDDTENPKRIIYHDDDMEFLCEHYFFNTYQIADYKDLDTIYNNQVFLGWTTDRDSDEVEYDAYTEISDTISLHPVFRYLDNVELDFKTGLVLGVITDDDADETKIGFVNLVIYNNNEKTEKRIEFKYDNKNLVDIGIKFYPGRDKMQDYDSLDSYLIDKNFFSESEDNNIITKIYVTLDSKLSPINEDMNFITKNGGYLDNVVGGSTIHIYVSSSFTLSNFFDGPLGDNIDINKTYVMNPDDLVQPEEYNNTNSLNDLVQDSVTMYSFNIVQDDDNTEIKLPSGYIWYINGEKIESPTIKISDLIAYDGTLIKLTNEPVDVPNSNDPTPPATTKPTTPKPADKVENPKTGVFSEYLLVIILTIIGLIIYYAVNKRNLFKNF